MSNKDYDTLFKIVMIGESGVGKSSILMRYCDNNFTDNFVSTIGIDFKFKTLEENGKRHKLQIWDTSGQERFKSITSSFYRGANGVVLVFDLTDKESFERLDEWMREARMNAGEEVKLVVVGNKSDLTDLREVSSMKAESFALQNGCHYFETSAKSDENVNSIFEKITLEMIQARKSSFVEEQQKLIPDLKSSPTRKTNTCRLCNIL